MFFLGNVVGIHLCLCPLVPWQPFYVFGPSQVLSSFTHHGVGSSTDFGFFFSWLVKKSVAYLMDQYPNIFVFFFSFFVKHIKILIMSSLHVKKENYFFFCQNHFFFNMSEYIKPFWNINVFCTLTSKCINNLDFKLYIYKVHMVLRILNDSNHEFEVLINTMQKTNNLYGTFDNQNFGEFAYRCLSNEGYPSF